ncbi:hypothetical protein APSETT444_006319 [Aspergillus pseudonomiae]
MDINKLKKGLNDTTESAKDQINKQKPGETANDALNKGKEQAASAADNAKAALDKALGKGENNNA